MKTWLAVAIALLLALPTRASTKDLQTQLYELSPTASDAVVPLYVWFDVMDPSVGPKRLNSNVLGTGFYVDRLGDFITAGHVLDLRALTSRKDVSNIRLTVLLRQRDGNGAGVDFTVVDQDSDHDLVLCRVKSFPGTKTKNAPTIPDSAQHMFASLAIHFAGAASIMPDVANVF